MDYKFSRTTKMRNVKLYFPEKICSLILFIVSSMVGISISCFGQRDTNIKDIYYNSTKVGHIEYFLWEYSYKKTFPINTLYVRYNNPVLHLHLRFKMIPEFNCDEVLFLPGPQFVLSNHSDTVHERPFKVINNKKNTFTISIRLKTNPLPSGGRIDYTLQPYCHLSHGEEIYLDQLTLDQLTIRNFIWQGVPPANAPNNITVPNQNDDLIFKTQEELTPEWQIAAAERQQPATQKPLDVFHESLIKEHNPKQTTKTDNSQQPPSKNRDKLGKQNENLPKEEPTQTDQIAGRSTQKNGTSKKIKKDSFSIKNQILTRSKQKIDSINWNHALQANKYLDYSRFLDNNKYRELAISNMKLVLEQEQASWKRATEKDEFDSYKNYIDRFPAGYYTIAAIDKLKKINPSYNVEGVVENSVSHYVKSLINLAETTPKSKDVQKSQIGLDTMFLKEAYLVSIEILQDTSGYFLKRPTDNESREFATTFELFRKISEKICIQLYDPNRNVFEIHPEKCINKIIDFSANNRSSNGLPLLWEWTVRPLKQGYNQLAIGIGRMEGEDFHSADDAKQISYIVIKRGNSKRLYVYIFSGLLLISSFFYLFRNKPKGKKSYKYFTMDADQKNKIKETIAKNEVLQAIEMAKKYSTVEESLNDLHSFSSQIHELKKEKYKGMIKEEDANIKLNKIKDNLLSYIDEHS